MAKLLPLDHAKVVRAVGVNGECGFCYRPDEHCALDGNLLITLDDMVLPSGLSLQEVFLHEVAHISSVGAEHDWHFLLFLNLLRMEMGFGPTTDAYDCQDEVSCYGISAPEVLRLAAETAADLRSRFDLRIAVGFVGSTARPYADSP
jgi:hypothetical protein